MTKVLNRDTLSKEQLKMEKNGYSFSLNNDGKMVTHSSDESIEYEKNIIRNVCKNTILSKYSMTDQANMTAKIAEINILCLLEKRTPTEDELLLIQEATIMISWIREERIKCGNEIISLQA